MPMQSMSFTAETRQSQTVSPRLQHAVRLLQMSSLDFGALVRDSLNRNPFLESEDGESDDGDIGEVETREGDAAVDAMGEEAPQLSDISDASAADDRNGDDRDFWQYEPGAGSRHGEDDGEFSALGSIAVEATLSAHLLGQLKVMPLPERDLALAGAIVESLDEDGYLRTPLGELVDAAALDPAPDPQEMMIALRRVQALDPLGVAARSVAECLQLQLPRIENAALRALAARIVAEQLQALAAGDIHALAKALDGTPARIQAACDALRRFDPRPGWRFGSSRVAYIVPDLIVKKVRNEWRVTLNPAVVPRIRLNEVYAALFQSHRRAQDREMAEHLQEARWTLRNVEQRFSTIFDVAQAIVRRQHHFFEFGAMAMKPLGLREIAEEVGVHESTVSRVTNNKYMATPIGVFELKYFFSRAMISANGSACSGTAIRGLIEELIQAEPPTAPLSDAAITRQLAEQGLNVARRTVTKYRQNLRIAAVDKRRRHACT